MTSRGRWTLICVLLVPAVVLPLLTWLYNRDDPTLFGFPFFYWFQMFLIIVAIVLTIPAYLLSHAAERADRVRHGLPPEPPAPPAGSREERP